MNFKSAKVSIERIVGFIPCDEDQFLEMVDKLPLSASIPFKSTDKEDHQQYLTPLDDHP